LTDDEWAFFEPFVTESGPLRGRPPRDHRRTLDAIFWIVRTGAPWRDLPEELAVVDYFAGLDVSLEETAICIVDGTGDGARSSRCQRAGDPGRVFQDDWIEGHQPRER
jgi:transposase